MHGGKRYLITCAALGLPESDGTKEASHKAANDWWNQQLSAITNPPREEGLSAAIGANLPTAMVAFFGKGEEALTAQDAVFQAAYDPAELQTRQARID